MTPDFRRESEDRVRIRLEPGEAGLLRRLEGQLRELIDQEEGGVHDRLFPRAYLDPTEDSAEQEWRRLMHADLLRSKLRAAEVFAESLERADTGGRITEVILEPDEVEAWLGALNDLRLALGVLLDVTPDTDPTAVRPEDPRAPGLHLYGWLTWLLGSLVDAVDPRQPGDPF